MRTSLRLSLGAARRAYSGTASRSSMGSRLLDELEQRGLLAASTSLHVGNLLPLMGLLHFSLAGHHSFALIGGATGSIGDPSGRSTERKALSPAELNHNVSRITAQVESFFDSATEYAARRRIGGIDELRPRVGVASGQGEGHGTQGGEVERRRGAEWVTVVNNLDWTGPVSLIDFLRDVGKLARVNVMLQRDSVRNRLDSDAGISFTEFSYQLLQAHDFAHLHRNRGVTVQLGGSDQWGNIVAGIDLIRRMRSDAELAEPVEAQKKEAAGKGSDAYGLTMPLLTTSSGEKFGKSAGNAVWLDPTRTSVSDFYQFFYRAEDADVHKYLGALTCLPLETIKEVMNEHNRTPKLRTAQKILAEEVTELVHGRDAVTHAQTIATALYSTSPRSLRASDVLAAFTGGSSSTSGSNPSEPSASGQPGRFVRIHKRDVKGVPVSKLAVTHGLCKSRNEAARLISSGGMYLNDLAITDPRREISLTDLIDGHVVVLRRGTRDAVVFYLDRD